MHLQLTDLTKCDLRREACGQCVRARLTCSDYRDTDQLRIRDESKAVVRKALKRKAESLRYSITPTLEDRAKNAFFSHYVFNNSKTYDFLQALYSATSNEDHLSMSIDAASLAFLSHQERSHVASKRAREKYAAALRLTSTALQCQETVKRDTTLLAAMLLDLFEKITNHEPRSTQSWTSHVKGALALVEVRGHEQFQDPVSLRMLIRLSTNLLITCVASELPVPAALIAVRAYASTFLNEIDSKWMLSDLMVKYANLRVLMNEGRLSDSQTIVSLLALDSEFAALSTHMQTEWPYTTVRVDPSSENVLEDYFHVYPDQHKTQTWNVVRLIRILINDMLHSLSISVSSPLFELATDSIRLLIAEICASVPQYLGHSIVGLELPRALVHKSLVTQNNNKALFKAQKYSAFQRLRCYTLIFPLYVAGQSTASTQEQKQWIIKRLHFMGGHVGIPNAVSVAAILEQGGRIHPWEVYALLGSYAFSA